MQPFSPVRALRSPHIQTLWPSLFRRVATPQRQRERLELPDGDFLDIDWLGPSDITSAAPVCVLLHGLTGSSNSHYMLALQVRLAGQGWRVAAINFRGCSGIPNRLPQVYHAGHTADIQAVLTRMRERHGGSFMAAVGYSLGGSMLANWLGRVDDGRLLQAACLVSVPYRLDLCSSRLDQGFSRVYRDHLLNNLACLFERKIGYFEALGDRAASAALRRLGDPRGHRSFWTFDDRIMAPLHGFTSVDDYYARCSTVQILRQIATATLVVQAEDDPFVPVESLPDSSSAAPAVRFLVSRHGGHLGFMGHQSRGPLGVYWLEEAIVEWLLEQQGQTSDQGRELRFQDRNRTGPSKGC